MGQSKNNKMHYVKLKTRIRIFMPDATELQRQKTMFFLKQKHIEYRYIKHLTCISISLKDEEIAKFIVYKRSLNGFIPHFRKKWEK